MVVLLLMLSRTPLCVTLVGGCILFACFRFAAFGVVQRVVCGL